MPPDRPCAGRRVGLVGKHGKERALAPVLARLGVELTPVAGVDTDAFGTFAGDVPRRAGPVETAIAKARAGLAAGHELALASEGSFGPDPAMPMVPVNVEHLALAEAATGRTIVASFATHRTNFGSVVAADADTLTRFLADHGFPAHAVVLRPDGWSPGDPFASGVTEEDEVLEAFERFRKTSPSGAARVDTDMRAHANPTRLRAIRRAGIVLARRLATPCPSCRASGFGGSTVARGLPCEDCGAPTTLPRGTSLSCDICGHVELRARRDGLTSAPAMHCAACNP
jgi:hypothetical protein